MPYGGLKINGYNAFSTWRLTLSDGALAALLTPAPNKERARNSSRLRHGVEIAGSVERKDSRELSLPCHITAPNFATGLSCYSSFCNILAGGTVDIELPDLMPDKIFRCKYISCSNFTSFRNEIMQFTLKLEEPNPNNRDRVVSQ